MDNDIFENGWNRDNAYIFGWIMSDGCLKMEGRNKTSYAVRICSNDLDIIKWLHGCLCVGNKIYSQSKNGYQIKFRNEKSILFMIGYGLKERKSLDVKFPSIPDAFIGDFIRGYFDGNGSIIMRTNRYNTYAQVSFTSGSMDFLKSMKSVFELHGIESHLYKDNRPSNRSYYLRIIKRSEIEKVFSLMYSDVNKDAFLSRKYMKFLNYLDCKPKYKITA